MSCERHRHLSGVDPRLLNEQGRRDYERALRPSDVSEGLSWFDRFASRAAALVSRAWFFFACLALVLLWVPSWPLFGSVDTWQLALNSPTTAITFLLVALIQNTQKRADAAVQRKLNAIAEALADLLEEYEGTETDLRELRAAVGLEQREGST